MSTTSPSVLSDERTTSLHESVRSAARTLQTPLQAAGFWAAVVLPFGALYLLAGGIEGGESLTLAVLLFVNALALVVGHGHRR